MTDFDRELPEGEKERQTDCGRQERFLGNDVPPCKARQANVGNVSLYPGRRAQLTFMLISLSSGRITGPMIESTE